MKRIDDPMLSELVGMAVAAGIDMSELLDIYEHISFDSMLEITLNSLIETDTAISRDLFKQVKEYALETRDPDLIGPLEYIKIKQNQDS
ncbi:MAG: hypothetical protein Q4C71_00565 [Microbacteriaceae bacterium]|nr:hypothetical protein [Microbacteriaceae bacterium]